MVITSPPYLNAIDYLRCSKFSLVWMGYSVSELRRLRSTTVGTEVGMDARDDQEIQRILSELKLQPKLHARQEAMLARYINDMQRAVSETSRVLAGDGRAVYVVGENTVRGTFIRNAMIVEAVASTAGTSLHCAPFSRATRKPPILASSVKTVGNGNTRQSPAPRGDTHVSEGGVAPITVMHAPIPIPVAYTDSSRVARAH